MRAKAASVIIRCNVIASLIIQSQVRIVVARSTKMGAQTEGDDVARACIHALVYCVTIIGALSVTCIVEREGRDPVISRCTRGVSRLR
jgi:hypothetical protein